MTLRGSASCWKACAARAASASCAGARGLPPAFGVYYSWSKEFLEAGKQRLVAWRFVDQEG
jgi:hypothetical protein